ANLLDGLTPLAVHWPGWGVLLSGLVWKAAVTFALIASAETLLCAVAVDAMHAGPRTRFDRELAAQGVGNVVCGALGALPMTGVIVRSSANVGAGARTRRSAILHGAWLLLFVSLFPGLLSRIPLAALAAIIATDLLTGVVLGVVLSAAKLLWTFSHLDVVREDDPEHKRVHLYLDGAGTFLRLPKLAGTLD